MFKAIQQEYTKKSSARYNLVVENWQERLFSLFSNINHKFAFIFLLLFFSNSIRRKFFLFNFFLMLFFYFMFYSYFRYICSRWILHISCFYRQHAINSREMHASNPMYIGRLNASSNMFYWVEFLCVWIEHG